MTTPGQLRELLEVPFSDEQLAAVTAPLEPSVIVAGAGTGKTTVMAARVVWLVGTGQVAPDQVLGLTFTRKAAGELATRIGAALERAGIGAGGPAEAADVDVFTYDSFAGRLVNDQGLRIGLTDARLISGAMTYRLASEVVVGAPGPLPNLGHYRPATLIDRVLKLDAALQAHLVDPQHVRDHFDRLSAAVDQEPKVVAGVRDLLQRAGERVELLDLVDEYRAAKRAAGVVEFADQMAAAHALVRGAGEVARTLRERYRVILLDEYQDTSAAQADVLASLFTGPTPAAGRGHAVTAVGDPNQAIYGWRGAASSNLAAFAATFVCLDGSPATSYPLTINRRSGTRILTAANELSAPLRTADASASGELVAPAGALRGALRAASFSTKPEEVAWLAQEIVEAGRSGSVPDWAQIAVLVRRNADIVPIYEALSDLDVPVEIVGLAGLLYLPEMAAIVSTLRLCLDPAANADAAALLAGPRWQVGVGEIAELTRRARELARRSTGRSRDAATRLSEVGVAPDVVDEASLLEAINDLGDASIAPPVRRRLVDFAAEIAGLRARIDEPVADFVRRVVNQLGIEIEVSASPTLHASARAAQLDAFLDVVGEFVDVDGGNSLAGLLAYFDAELESGVGLEQAVPSNQDSVKIMTVHRAKGLEWDLVALPFLTDGVFPAKSVTDNWVSNPATLPSPLRGDRDAVPQLGALTKAGLDEFKRAQQEALRLGEDRLAYVAVTRARRALIATAHHWAPGKIRPREFSPYFAPLAQLAAEDGQLIHEAPELESVNPLVGEQVRRDWPQPIDEDHAALLGAAGDLVRGDLAYLRAGEEPPEVAGLSSEDANRVAAWAAEASALVAAERARRSPAAEIELPRSISASALIRSARDPQAFARELLRPMPRPISDAALLGSRFHEWVEHRFATRSLIEPAFATDDETATDLHADQQLAGLQDAFLVGPYADLVPEQVEVPFVLLLGDRQIRGRIDAVYRAEAPLAYQVVDWKTTNSPPDPLQLACYRLAWAEAHGLDVEAVDAVFHHVRTGRVIRPAGLPGRAELERLAATSVLRSDEPSQA